MNANLSARRMKLINPTLAALVFSVAFCAYGGGRTMESTLGLSLSGLWSRILVGGLHSVILLTIAAIVFLLPIKHSNRFQSSRYYLSFFIIAAVGFLVSELVITLDEKAFRDEIARQKPPATVQHRARIWPFTGTSLVYHPERGHSATD